MGSPATVDRTAGALDDVKAQSSCHGLHEHARRGRTTFGTSADLRRHDRALVDHWPLLGIPRPMSSPPTGSRPGVNDKEEHRSTWRKDFDLVFDRA
jgi:hypothetical protein